jgi:hypothetical protein
MTGLDKSAQSALGKLSPKTAWFLITDKVIEALDMDQEKSQQLAEEMSIFGQPDDPIQLQDLTDLVEVVVGMNPVKGINFLLYINPELNIHKVQEMKPLEVLEAVLWIFKSDRWAMQF